MIKIKHSFAWLLLPLVILILLGASMAYERSGVEYQQRYPPIQFLPPTYVREELQTDQDAATTLVIYNSDLFFGEEYITTVFDTLDSMRIKYDAFDVISGETLRFEQYDAVIVSLFDLQIIEQDMLDLVEWVETGGRVMFSIRPDPSDTFTGIYRKLGILSVGDGLVSVQGIEFVRDLLPGGEQITFDADFLQHSSFPVALDEAVRIYAVSADRFATPLIWSYGYGDGNFVFVNSDQFITKSSRGILGASYSLLFDVFAYPVINASVFFIDDFPGPIPEGSNAVILEQYGRDIQSFLINVWWPDVEAIAAKYNLFYTGVLMETYNDNLTPPFVKQPEIERHQYFGGLVLSQGGGIGIAWL